MADKLRLALVSMKAQMLLSPTQRLLLAQGTQAGEFRRHIGVTQDKLAGMLGVSRQTTNQILQALKDQGLIALQRGELEALDIDALHALSQ
ncbi:helix-turn-helix domain-containing protein [Hydrogenophaga sp.]|uniref:Crp/Fnr family transcriptional regulator n=1 Tax=Hydrogenophaga sp. TaxID=1904254 RepID=UPI0025C4D651|nr:helix-turn-helix domain-containing protein [Hydrogenophaga sp.]